MTAPKIENPTQSSRPRFKENEGRSEKMLKFKLKYIGLCAVFLEEDEFLANPYSSDLNNLTLEGSRAT